ncbi:NLR family, CARD domain containing 5 isoform X3 [Melanotaenia boesemani]|uniref:NLR family, CARD domain containing 5 isoform X3 n=1 Tax=Melanotaenia boesemani TaxID=1250792 RepID=UPI001C04EE69|nr:NLR family, CARD domain containing 5 isoform X3 [Melanotaenia boesemani]
MDEEVDPDCEKVNSVLDQESLELFHVLCCQTPPVIMRLWNMMPTETGWQNQHSSTSSAAASVEDRIKAMLEYFREASTVECRNFLLSVCMQCENIPMRLESRLMSVAGYASSGSFDSATNESDQKSSTPPFEEQLIKRPRIDHWEQYVSEVMSLLQRRWGRLTECLVKEVQLEKVWVGPRTANKHKDRPDQTPNSADRGSRTPEPDGDYGYLESKVTLETFLQACTGKVTVLVGQAGSGKTLLMSCLGQQWTNGLGPIPSSYLFVLLEFRQLNVVSCPLSLSDLLFQHYLPPNANNDAKQAIVDYLLSNPEQSCWVLDGYDEFHWKLDKKKMQSEPLDFKEPLPVAELISGLLNRQLLAGSTILVTCRVRDLIDFDGLSDKVGELLGWDQHMIKEYVSSFFGEKDRSLGMQATDLLLSSRHLLVMSSLPALCNICCICLEHLLLEGSDAQHTQLLEEEGSKAVKIKLHQEKGGGRGGDRSRRESHPQRGEQSGKREGNKDILMFSPTSAGVPTTLTQVYLSVISAFLSRYPNQGERYERPKTSTFSQSSVCALASLSQYRSELYELARLAWGGLETNKILFVEEDVPKHVLELSVKTGLLSQVELRCHDGTLVSAYCFIHLTVQEFLAALRIMTCNDISDAQLKKRFSLKTRWTTKSDQKTVFTDSLYLYVCGLSSPHCTEALVEVARASGIKGIQSWVKKRQALVLNLLKALCQNNNLTGPKILQLCRCVQESQDHQLAKLVMTVRPTLELRNFWLSPNDIDALAFVVNSVGDDGIGLDFRACSMELECLDALSRCQYIHYLSFRSRKYGDKFAEKLSSILPEFKLLRKLEFCGASLTATGAASLTSGLQNCPHITDINLSDNNLQDEGIRHITQIFTKLQSLVSVTLGRNNTSLKAVEYLVQEMSSCLNIQHIHADGMKEVRVTFFEKSDVNGHKTKLEPTVSLLNQKWSKDDMTNLAKSLTRLPALSVLDLSGGQWDEEILRTLAEFVPKFRISERIILNDSCSSVVCVVALTTLLSVCPVMELHIGLQNLVQISIIFNGKSEKPVSEMSKKLCLSCCNLLPADFERVWKSLGTSSGLTELDLSHNHLGNKGLKKLLDVLPRLSEIQEINASNNDISMNGVVMLAGALCSRNTLKHIYISNGGKEQVILKFSPNQSNGKEQMKMFRINNSNLLPSNITDVCRRLVPCRFHLELELLHCSFADRAIDNLLKVLPTMSSLQRLNVSNSITSTTEALTLINCLINNQRITSVELSPQSESLICFDRVKAKQVSCRLAYFCFKEENIALMERLLKNLQLSQQLSYLDLSNNQLEDEDVKILVDSLPRLKISSFVNLSNNKLAQQGVLDVASTLCTCSNVSDVDVSLGEDRRCLIWFSDKGCGKTLSVRESNLACDHLVRLAEIVSNCPSLTKLELKNNKLQSEWIEDFVKLLNSSQRVYTVSFFISVEEHWIRAKEAVSLLCRCLELSNNIQTIRIHHTTLHLSLMNVTQLTTISGEATLPAQSIVTNIGFVDCAVDGYQLASMWSIIQQCHLLTELDFSYNSLDTEGTNFLCSLLPLLPSLTSLSIAIKESTVSVAEEFSQALRQYISIQHLNLSGHVISDTAAQNMTTFLPRLRSLNLSRCVWSAAGGMQLMETLEQCISLEDLCLDYVQLNEKSLLCLAQALRKINSLQSLKLDGWRMACSGIEQLTKFLPVWKELRVISLSKNLVSDQSGEKLLEALSSCSHLQELYLSSNSLGDLTAARMALVLPSLTHLTVLDISENQIGTDGSAKLSEAIKNLKNLNKINLTSVGTSDLSAVAASLVHCPVIQDVSLGWNNCGDDVVLELARVLPFCHKMTRIDLESNSVSVCGVEALVGALRSSPALQIIRLWRNKVSSNEAHRFSLTERRLNFSST